MDLPERFSFDDEERYRISRIIGRGSYGTVYKITNSAGRRYACKVFDPNLIRNPEQLRRFQTETHIGINFLHEHLVSIHKSLLIRGKGEHEGKRYPALIMDYVDGVDLATFKKQYQSQSGKPFPRDVATLLLAKICSGLDVLHRHQIRHGDLKPENILISKTGYPKLTDYGISSFTYDPKDEEAIDGTIRYLAPEQIVKGLGGDNPPVDHHADLYALGLVALELTTGLPPELYGPMGETVRYIVEANHHLQAFVQESTLPADLKFVIKACLQPDIERRPRHVRELQNVLFQTIYGQSKGITLEDIGDVVQTLTLI